MRIISSSAVPDRRALPRFTVVLLTGTALAGVTLTGAALAMLASTPAQAFGGPGTSGGGNGGFGGTHGNGGDGSPGSGGAAGGLGGTSPGADGLAGSDDAVNGGGASGADTSVGTLNNTGVMTGGKGGNGGAAGLWGGGGGGGGGGGQISITGTGAMSNSGTVIGGAGGSGGSGNGGGMDGVGARGGSGLVFTMGGVTFTNSGTIIGGASGSSSYVGEVGGNGILATSDITVVNSGSIAGGMSGDGLHQGPAIWGLGNVSVHNTGSTSTFGIIADLSVTVTNAATGLIQGGFYGIDASRSLNITNDGAIFGGIVAIINGGIGPGDTVINRAGNGVTNGIILGDVNGIFSHSALTVTNSGAILGTAGHAIGGFSHITVTNYAGDGVTTGIISGGINGITGFGVSRTVTVTNAGTITGGNAAIQANGVANVSNTGIISGGYGIIAGGGNSSVLNAGTIAGSIAAIQFGGSGNTLTMATGSTINGLVLGTGSDTLQLGGTGVATFNISALSNSGQYQGFSTLNKVDSSIWTLSGTSTYTGGVNVNGGTLVVNGNLSSAGIMFINPGGTLSGTGIVPFTLLDDGATLAPGPANGTGTLTINDRVRFCACSTYAVKVSGTGNDLANVVAGGLGGGDAFLGGLVRVTSPTASYRFNSAYTILSTQGGLNGTTFDSLVTPTAIGGVLAYTANDVLLTLTSQLGKVAGLNANQQSLATRLDTAFNTSGNTGALGGLFTGNIAQNLTQASGETATGSQQTTFTAMTQFMNTMTDQFTAGRGFDAPGAPGFADEDSSASAYASTAKTRAERDAYAMLTKAPLAKVYYPRWSVWAAGFGGSQTTDGNAVAGSNAATSRIGGVAVGADYRFSPNTIVGFALTGGATSFNVANGGSGRSDLFQAGAFVRHTIGAAYLSGALAYGWQDVTTNRTVIADQLQARFNANAFSGRVEGGYRVVMPWIGGLGLTPYVAGQFTTIALPNYAESNVAGSNAFALAYAANSVTATRSELGFRTDKSFSISDAILTLRGRAAWAHDFNTDRSIAATFQTLPASGFTVKGAAQARDAALVSAGAEMRWRSGFSLAGTFEGEFSRDVGSYAGKGTVRYQW